MNILSFQGRINRLQFLVVSLILTATTTVLFAIFIGLAVLAHGVTHSTGDTTVAQFTQDIQQHHHAAYSASSVSAGFAPSGILVLAFFGLGLLLSWIGVAAQVKRFHDMGQSGWLTLINLVPGAGFFVWLVLVLASGQSGPNTYGPSLT